MSEEKELTAKEVIKKMLDAQMKKALEVAETMSTTQIKIGESAGEGKSFEHFMKWSTESAKMAENMLALEKKYLGTEDEESEPASNSQISSNGSSRLVNKFSEKK